MTTEFLTPTMSVGELQSKLSFVKAITEKIIGNKMCCPDCCNELHDVMPVELQIGDKKEVACTCGFYAVVPKNAFAVSKSN